MSDLPLIERVEGAIWRQDAGALSQMPQADPGSWGGSVQLDYLTYGIQVPLSFPTTPAAAFPGVAVVMMVKDEEDIIGHNLEWLQFVGVRRIMVSDNASNDGTREAVMAFQRRHPNCEVILRHDPVVSYTQSVKTTNMLRFAIAAWPGLRWVFPVDADEFLIPSQGFEPLDGLPADVDALTIPKVIHVRHRSGGELNTGSPLGLMALRNPLFCVPPKCACRARLDLAVTGGNHSIYDPSGRRVIYQGAFALGIYYREFQTRSFEHFLKKVRNGGPAILTARREGRAEGGDHWVLWFDMLNNEGEDSLRRLYEGNLHTIDDPHYTVDPFHGCPVADAAAQRL